MIGPIAGLTLLITWLFSALMLTVGIYAAEYIKNPKGDTKFWSPFPKTLLATAILTFTDWGIGSYYLSVSGNIAKITVWFIVILITFRIHFFKTLLLAILLFLFKLLFITFIISSLVPLMASFCL
jgi:hypothetical protein